MLLSNFIFRVRVDELNWPNKFGGARIRSLLIDKIYSKCNFYIEQLKGLKKKFDAEVVEKLSEASEEIWSLAVACESDQNLTSPAIERISLKTLAERAVDIDVLFKVRSDQMCSVLEKLSKAPNSKSVPSPEFVSSAKVDAIFGREKDGKESLASEPTVGSILANYNIGDFNLTTGADVNVAGGDEPSSNASQATIVKDMVSISLEP